MNRGILARRHVLIAALAVCFVAFGAAAELQNVEVGGRIRIRGSYWHNTFNPGRRTARVLPQTRWPSFFLPFRAIGDVAGGQNAASYYAWDSRQPDYRLVEQRTRVNVSADFTNDAGALIEFDSFEVWGEDFRSNYVTGADNRAATADDIEVYQAYIEMRELFGLPLMARVGRQELVVSDGWLVGNNDAIPEFSGLSFDAVMLEFHSEALRLSGFCAKLSEAGATEEDGDVDLYGLYGKLAAAEWAGIEAYWVWLRDGRSVNDTNFIAPLEWVEDLANLDDYDVTNIHTLAVRLSGAAGGLDYDVHGAYQFGEADSVGALFSPFLYGDDGARFGQWAGDVEIGYTLELAWSPRVYAGGAWFGGEDHRDVPLEAWLNPFRRSRASVSFNRLFSNVSYSPLFDEIAQLSNFWSGWCGVDCSPTERLELGLRAAYFEVIDAFDRPAHVRAWGFIVPVAPALPFWTTPSGKRAGWETGLRAVYSYSGELRFEAGWSHLFTGPALEDGNYIDANGLGFNGGTGREDADYFYVETTISF